MKILILCPKVPYPPIDGGAIASLSLARHLAKTGNNVTMLAINTSKHSVDSESIPQNIKKDLNLNIVDINTDIKIFKALSNLLFSKLPYNGERFFTKDFSDKLIKLLKTNTYDIIQLEGLYMGLYLENIRKYSDAPVVMRSHNVEHIIWQRNAKFENNVLKKYYYKLLSKRIYKLEKRMTEDLDAYVPITNHDAKIFRDMGAKIPIHVAMAGISEEEPGKLLKVSYSSVFFIGAMDWIPNQEGIKWFVDNVWPTIYKRYPEKILHIAGRNAPGWLIEHFKKPGIKFHGEIPDAKEYMAEHGIMIVPLFAGSGMRIKILEGMSLGITIITTTIGLEGIAAKADEEIILSDTENNFIEKICFVFENTDICRKIGEKARDFVYQNYDNNSIAEGLISFYKSVTQ